MPSSECPCLSLAIARLTAAEPEHYAIWVLSAPYPAGHVHHDQRWSAALTEIWHHWQSFFSLRGLPDVPHLPLTLPPPSETKTEGQVTSYTGRLMQQLGVMLWQWLFDGPIQTSFTQSKGMAMGQGKPLRLRLEIRDPDLMSLPWEIMQSQPGTQAVALSQQLLFSRTTSDVEPLPPTRTEQALNVLLVLGQDQEIDAAGDWVAGSATHLSLEQEAASLAAILESAANPDPRSRSLRPSSCQVKTLVQPTPAELIEQLETGIYNVLFYAGHGERASDGGLLHLRSDAAINGTELAQVLVRCQVKLAVFNSCWGAQPETQDGETIARSSLVEVLIHHGVPAVLAMRDSIADEEALSFIQEFTQALANRAPIDQAVAVARQHLLTLYKFNQPAWTLPVLYMHPEFNGELIRPYTEGVTEIPDNSPNWYDSKTPAAVVRTVNHPERTWLVRGGVMRVGSRDGNDLVLPEVGVSREHAEIVFRNVPLDPSLEPNYFLRDRSRYGTWVLMPESPPDAWYRVHQQEVPLRSKTQLKFGGLGNQALEFVVESISKITSPNGPNPNGPSPGNR